jgi:hypothetical protein
MIAQVNMGKIHQPADVPNNESFLEGKRSLIFIPIEKHRNSKESGYYFENKYTTGSIA